MWSGVLVVMYVLLCAELSQMLEVVVILIGRPEGVAPVTSLVALQKTEGELVSLSIYRWCLPEEEEEVAGEASGFISALFAVSTDCVCGED